MTGLRDEIRRELHPAATIDPADEVERRVTFLADYLRTTPARGYVLGISGGQDSTLAGRLSRLAVERISGDAEFVAVQLPYGQQSDQSDVDIALEFIAPTLTCNVDIKSMVDAASSAAAQGLGVEQISDFVRGNIKARQRMVAQYTIAGERNLLVVGTDHAAEAVTGFFSGNHINVWRGGLPTDHFVFPLSFVPAIPTTNKPERLASLITAFFSIINELPALKAIPARLAAIALSIVVVPIVGRSIRCSWLGLTTFTITPPAP